eukprot:2753406-Pleurochrysis_carterae.AAC.3
MALPSKVSTSLPVLGELRPSSSSCPSGFFPSPPSPLPSELLQKVRIRCAPERDAGESQAFRGISHDGTPRINGRSLADSCGAEASRSRARMRRGLCARRRAWHDLEVQIRAVSSLLLGIRTIFNRQSTWDPASLDRTNSDASSTRPVSRGVLHVLFSNCIESKVLMVLTCDQQEIDVPPIALYGCGIVLFGALLNNSQLAI